MDSYTIKNGALVAPGGIKSSASISVKKGILETDTNSGLQIDLRGASTIYPALINVHDHLRGNYLPRVGPKEGVFYLNWLPWDNDLKASPIYSERSNLSVENLYFLSAYKNLFSGVVTVNDHFPHELNKELLPRLPIRASQDYCLAHECSSFDLKWGDGIELEHERAKKNGWPFITHLEEGFDSESQDGVGILERLGRLDSRCLFIHCIGFSDEDIRKVAAAGSSISWCPASNKFMFNVTCKIKKIIQAGINVAIGTDSTHTGSVNLLSEMKYARQVYREMYEEELPADVLFKMVTINPAKAFMIEEKTGSLESGKWADVLVLTRHSDDVYEDLAQASMGDIELLIKEGVPIYGELRFLDLLGSSLPAGYSEIQVDDKKMFVIGNPSSLYRELRQKVGFPKVLEYLPFEPIA